ncbi:gliding motility lipoprotein GldB [Belliella aquatica]|uniref:Gliding motility lipoprotein GldB n=1 Tax=Belliella aquatica TaxID=1323734 RepID=A0ABQ1LND8_9BACT|nr:gliding motility lipoprotein GldB [Belliella aquatica]MCH7404231.1 gliding motility lipoprotein GldB [Belliella aquatica]GGC26387.1 gliding motility lipoprotein GldB [Belliella aquatica]
MNTKSLHFILTLSCGLFLLSSCGNTQEKCELDEKILDVPIDLSIVRLEKQFYTASTEEEFLFLLEEYPDFAKDYLEVELYESKEQLAQELMFINQDTLMQELYAEVQENYPDLNQLDQDLSHAFAYIKYHFPDFNTPKVYTFLTGFSNDLYISDEMIVIGLDYFLPKEHEFQPTDLPRYISDRYDREYIVPMVVTAISSKYNKVDPKQNTLLAEMIFYGKAYHFTKSILPCTADDFIIGYTSEEVVACFANEEFIWSHFIENDLLYETNPFEIRKYTGEAPATDVISQDAPGRVGRWLGWNIVDDYRFNNDISLDELMEMEDVEKLFRQSGYKPRQ